MKLTFSLFSLFLSSVFGSITNRNIPLSLRMSPYALLHDTTSYFNKRSGFRNIINPAHIRTASPETLFKTYSGIEDFFMKNGKNPLARLTLNPEKVQKSPKPSFFNLVKNM
ncbi:Oidioi.mRNA.OKI2018_I69.PAR.g9605.t1.cds [Oikopleura dioica]|uniref:Oidioi.mRNA.OKI2018_I69.PAR.g9605.t1.cds n=1 Tax=Oikopleura dioica TaxID=34765 RepID=A0ABN7RQU3_OIKDI|nr:Oidioi.mRNA.OKI2018_I69.PAR.g9605.t1.cds [Oikopleura dioica]